MFSLNSRTSQQNEKTCTNYRQMFNANDTSMNCLKEIV